MSSTLTEAERRRISGGLAAATDKELAEEKAKLALDRLSTRAILKNFNDIQSEPLQWLWPGRVPLGKLVVAAGDAGLGKSLLAVYMAACITTGRAFCDGTMPDQGDVLLISAEDDAGDTIRPRLEAAGADLTRIDTVDAVEVTIDGQKRERGFTLADVDVIKSAILQKKMEGRSLRVVVIDPISAYYDQTNANQNAEVRGLLRPLAELARQEHLTILFVTHLRKASAERAQYRVTGSHGLVAACRAAWLVAEDQDQPEWRLFAPVKMNLGPKPDSRRFRVIGTDTAALIEWDPLPVETDADELLDSEHTSEHSQRIDAMGWLESRLQEGSVEARTLLEEARADGLSERTLYRAKKKLHVESKRESPTGAWQWVMPDCQTAMSSDSTTWQSGNLGDNRRRIV